MKATILVAKKGYSPKLRHIVRTHKVNLGSIAEQLEEGTASKLSTWILPNRQQTYSVKFSSHRSGIAP